MAHEAKGAVFAAVTAALGNFLQGWDNASIAGAVLYIKKEFHLEAAPTTEGLIVAMSLIGATAITTFSGAIADMYGRRYALRISSVLYFTSGLFMLWAPNVYVLLLARLLQGFGAGLAVTLVPLYISEISPPEIRGQLNTLPQLGGSSAMFLSYCVVFGMSLGESPRWRLMLGMLSLISLAYLGFMIFYLPESPRWLVSKGRMAEARQVLQRLRGRRDVSGELALLVEGLATGGDVTLEEYTIEQTNELGNNQETPQDKDQIKFYDPASGHSLIAKPAIGGQSSIAIASNEANTMLRSGSIVDPVVTLFETLNEKLSADSGGTRSMLFPTMGSIFNTEEPTEKNEQWEEEGGNDYASDPEMGLESPLMSSHRNSMASAGNTTGLRHDSSLLQGSSGELVTDIGGGWQLAYKYQDDEKKGLKRIYFHKENTPVSQRGSLVSVQGSIDELGETIQTAALVSQSVLSFKDVTGEEPVDLALTMPIEAAIQGPIWRNLCEPGVKHALFVGMGLLILQQFSGINGVLYYTPQLLEQAGVAQLLANTGISSTSASILMSTFTMLVMLPCILMAMRLMDVAGRRSLMLNTIPILIVVLLALIFSKIVDMGFVASAVISTAGVVLYLSVFVMGLGPIPNILYAEIFPTKVRGLCMAICSLTYWIFNMIVTYSLPLLLSSIGLAGVFGIYAVACVFAWIFIYLKVPETKGMPLEVITEIFAAGAKRATHN